MKFWHSLRNGGLPLVALCYLLFNVYEPGIITKTLLFSLLAILTIKKSLIKDTTGVLIIIFSLFYSVLAYVNGNITEEAQIAFLMIPPICFYLYGASIIEKSNNKNNVIDFTLVIIFFFILRVVYSSIYAIVTGGSLVNITRELSFTSNENIIVNATLIGLNISLALIGLPMLFDKNLDRTRKLVFGILFIGALLTTIYLVNRTALIIAVVCFFMVMIYYSKDNIRRLFVASFIMAILAFIIIRVGLISPDAISAYSDRNDNIGSMGDRSRRWLNALGFIFTEPFGWIDNFSKDYYVHNLWLDVDRVAGIIPFVLLLMISIKSAYNLYKISTLKNDSLIALFIGIQVVCFTASFVEPVLQGNPIFFMLYMLFCGISNKYCKIIRKGKSAITTNE